VCRGTMEQDRARGLLEHLARTTRPRATDADLPRPRGAVAETHPGSARLSRASGRHAPLDPGAPTLERGARPVSAALPVSPAGAAGEAQRPAGTLLPFEARYALGEELGQGGIGR